MIFSLFPQARSRERDTIATLYGAIVAQARHPLFYTDYGVPDTLDARFDMVVLHVALLWRQMRHQAAPFRALGQDVFDCFCRDMEDNLREMGASDLAVPRKMRRVAEAFYGRCAAYDAALAAADDEMLLAVLCRNVLGGEAGPCGRRLTGYVRAAVGHLAAHDTSALAAGMISFPDPALPNQAAGG